MEVFYQYVGRGHGATADDGLQLHREKQYVYSSPHERTIDRCGLLPVGAYFACSELLYYEDQCWMKIRRGPFSNTAKNGYLRVTLDHDEATAPKQRSATALHRPRRFHGLHQLPSFPAFLCAREPITLSRSPMFQDAAASAASSSSSSKSSSSPMASPRGASTLRHQPHHHAQAARKMPVASVFQATEWRFNADFTVLALKVTSTFGLSGWIHESFADALRVVEDPREPIATTAGASIYMQNIAPRTGKRKGELPIRATPSLHAPTNGKLTNFRITTVVERKLVKDHVWLRLERAPKGKGTETEKKNANGDQEAEEKEEEEEEAWVIERHAHTAERVMVPWGADDVHDRALRRDDYEERCYRNIYGQRALPLRRSAALDADIVGELPPGSVVTSTRRLLNDRGQIWIRITLSLAAPVSASSTPSSSSPPTSNASSSSAAHAKESVLYGYAIQSSAKTNVCMLQEIPMAGKMTPKQFFQVVVARATTSSDASGKAAMLPTDEAATDGDHEDSEANSDDDCLLTVHAEPSTASKRVGRIRDGAIFAAIGSILNAHERTMWLQVLQEDVDTAMLVEPTLLPHERAASGGQAPAMPYMFYIPIGRGTPGASEDTTVDARAHEGVVFAVGRAMQKISNPERTDASGRRTGARVVFSGRASKLFGSQLLQPSTITLAAGPMSKKGKHGGKQKQGKQSTGLGANGSSSSFGAAAVAAGEVDPNDPTLALKNEIDAWQRQSAQASNALLASVKYAGGMLLACVQRPIRPCLQRKEAHRKYMQLFEEDSLAHGHRYGDDDDDDDEY